MSPSEIKRFPKIVTFSLSCFGDEIPSIDPPGGKLAGGLTAVPSSVNSPDWTKDCNGGVSRPHRKLQQIEKSPYPRPVFEIDRLR